MNPIHNWNSIALETLRRDTTELRPPPAAGPGLEVRPRQGQRGIRGKTVVLLLGVLISIPTAAHAQTTIRAATDINPMCVRPNGDSPGDVPVVGTFPNCSGNPVLWSSVRNGLRSDLWLRNHVTGTPDKALTFLGLGAVGLRPYSGTDPNQLWLPIYVRTSNGADWFVLYQQTAGQCLQAPSGPPFSNTTLGLTTCPSPWSAAARNSLFDSSLFARQGPPILVDTGRVTVRVSAGSAPFDASSHWTGGSYFGSRATFFADVTGDGKADAIVVNDNTVTVRRSSGTAFNANEDWTHGSFFGSRGTFFADVTGDGWADAIAVNDDTVTVRRAAADCNAFGCSNFRFNANEDWTQGPFFGNRGTFFADVTGDGRADAIVVNDGTVSVRRAAADCGLVGCSNFRFNPSEDWTHGAYFGNRGTFFADVTGDGRADAIAVNDGTVTVRRAAADCNVFGCSNFRFDPNKDWTQGPYFGSRGTFFADVTGGADHRADAIVVND